MRVLLTNAYFYRLDAKQWRFKQPYPPLATLLCAAVLREARFEVRFFDCNLRHGPDEIAPVMESVSPDVFIICDDGFNYLSKMCLTQMRDAALRMVRRARQNDCTVIVSSSDATDHAELYHEAGAHFIVRGEPEQTMLELLTALRSGTPVDDVPGLSFRRQNDMVKTAPRVVMKDLDRLPLPAWDLVDMDEYRRIWIAAHGYFSLNVATTRGCPYKCNWCAKPIYGNRYNSRSPASVAGEIALLVGRHGADHIWMCDDIFGLKPGWVGEFSRIVGERKLKFRYKIQSRVDLLLEKDTIAALAASGADTVWVGAESGAQHILDAMDKGTTVAQIGAATALLRKEGIRTAYFLQFGYPGETAADVESTIRMVLENMPDEIGISVSYPLPGTKFYERVRDQLAEKQNWTDSDDLAMMFHGRHSTRYYRRLHRYVHSVYRKKKGMMTLKKIMKSPVSLSGSDVKSLLGVIYFGVRAVFLRPLLNATANQQLSTTFQPN